MVEKRSRKDEGRAVLKVQELQSKQELDMLRQEIDTFSRTFSHDLQAPIRRIIGLCQIINDDHIDGLDDLGKKCLEMVSSEALRMNSMMMDLQIWSRASVCELNEREVDLSELISRIIDEIKRKEGAPRIDAVIAPRLMVRADQSLIEMAMTELIENSIKFAKEDAVRHIEFGQEHIGNENVLFIRDDGVGFDTSHAQRMFQPFQRIHGPEYPGIGMGLALASLIIKRHGGRIWAESLLDKGSTFYFVLKQ